MKQIAWLIGGFVAWTCSVNAQVIVQHVGTNNPVTEGFTQTGTIVGSPTNDMGTNAWHILDTTSSDRLRYDFNLTSGQIAMLSTQGWKITWQLAMLTNVIDTPDTVRFSTHGVPMAYYLPSIAPGVGNRRYIVQLGRATNAVSVRLSGQSGVDTTFYVPSLASGFHTWVLENSAPGVVGANLYVDGIFLTNYNGFSDTSAFNLNWGSGLGNTPFNDTEWGLVLLQVPEPSALGLFMGAALVVSFLRRR